MEEEEATLLHLFSHTLHVILPLLPAPLPPAPLDGSPHALQHTSPFPLVLRLHLLPFFHKLVALTRKHHSTASSCLLLWHLGWVAICRARASSCLLLCLLPHCCCDYNL